MVNKCGADLDRKRAEELRQASTELGAATVALRDYPGGDLGAVPPDVLADHVIRLASRHRPDGMLVFDDTGITGHPDHQAATRAALWAASAAGLPVLAWTLPAAVASRLHAETGQAFAGQPAEGVDLCIRVDRTKQRRAATMHASQISPGAVFWRRLQPRPRDRAAGAGRSPAHRGSARACSRHQPGTSRWSRSASARRLRPVSRRLA